MSKNAVHIASAPEILNSWITPSGVTGRLRRGWCDHSRGDIALLAARAKQLGDTERELVTAIGHSYESSLRWAPACAGLHEPGRVGTTQVRVLAAELASCIGVRLSTSVVATSSTIVFPLSGVEIATHRGARVTIETTRHGLEVESRGRGLVLDLGGSKSRPQIVVSGSLPCVVPRDIEGVRVDTRRAGIRMFALDDRASLTKPTAAERGRLAAVLELLSRGAPDVVDELRESGTVLAPVRPYNAAIKRMSWSDPRARSVIYLGVSNVMDTLDLIVHEYSHLKLCVLQDSYDLLEQHDVPVIAPWRFDVRTAEGVVHGLYVFFKVAQTVERTFSVSEPTRRDLRRLAVWRVCIDEASRELTAAGAELTPVGRLIVDAIVSENDQALDELAPAARRSIPWARRVVREHLDNVRQGNGRSPWFLGDVE